MSRRPIPTSVKIAEGNRGKRKLTGDDFQPEAAEPERQKGLSFAARREWAFMVPYLLDRGVLTVVDGKALAAYCETYAQAEKALKMLNEQGAVVLIGGRSKTNPWFKVYKDTIAVMKSYLTEFGLTPASRARIKLPSKPKDDPLEAMLKAKAARQALGFVN